MLTSRLRAVRPLRRFGEWLLNVLGPGCFGGGIAALVHRRYALGALEITLGLVLATLNVYLTVRKQRWRP